MKILITTLLGLAMMVEGAAFLSKPKISVNKDASFEEVTLDKIIPFPQDNFAQKPDLKLDENSNTDKELEPLSLELLGIAIGNIKDPIAFIKDLASDKQGIYRLGSVIREAKVTRITMGEVVLDRNGRKETLRLSKRAMAWAGMNKGNSAIISVSTDKITVSKNGLLNESGNILNTLRNIKVKPYYRAKEVMGMMLEGVPEDSIIAQAGIRNKDIIKTVNNQTIDSYQKALQVFNKARSQSEIKVSLLRDGQVKNLSYSIRQ